VLPECCADLGVGEIGALPAPSASMGLGAG
jgi:hypothetical protein